MVTILICGRSHKPIATPRISKNQEIGLRTWIWAGWDVGSSLPSLDQPLQGFALAFGLATLQGAGHEVDRQTG